MKKYISAFVFLLYCCLGTPAARATEYAGVFVGTSYWDGFANLGTVNDATVMSEMLISECDWDDESGLVLLTEEQVTETNILNAIRAMPNTPGTTEMFFFSGHGDVTGLCPHDLQERVNEVQLQAAFNVNIPASKDVSNYAFAY